MQVPGENGVDVLTEGAEHRDPAAELVDIEADLPPEPLCHAWQPPGRLGVGQQDGCHFYAMQFIEGETLASLIESGKKR